MNITVRVDASHAIGTGHLVRCRTLARALRVRGVAVQFICRAHTGHGIGILRSDGFSVSELPAPEADTTSGYTEDYARWRGVSQAQDADETINALKQRPDWLIVDHYGLDNEWERRLRSHVGHILAIDDLANREHECDLLLDQNYFADPEARYSGLVPPHCQLLTGPRYALLRPEYSQMRRLRGPRRGDVSRVLVFYGGVDPTNETARALRVLSRPQFRYLAVDVVVGANNPHHANLRALAAERPLTDIHGLRPHLADLMAEADLALGAGGTTTWERCAAGLPAVVTVLSENQEPFNRALAQDGVIRNLGRFDAITDDDLAAALAELIKDPATLQALAERAWRITDALGALRVGETLFPTDFEALTLRPARAEDVTLYCDWFSDPEVYRHAVQSEPVDWSTHNHWFEEWLQDVDTILWVMATPQGLPVGQVRVERDDHEAVLNFTLDRTFHGRGWDHCLLELAVTAWKREGESTPLAGGILPTIAASQWTFLRAGFAQMEGEARMGALSITVLSDRVSWINAWIPRLLAEWLSEGHLVRWVHQPEELVEGDLCFLLSCGQRVEREQLAKHHKNLVVHESDLPKGRGWSPLTWLVLEGAERVPVTLIEAVEQVDAGDIYLQEWFELEGTELLDDLRAKQGQTTLELCRQFVAEYPRVLDLARPQHGEPTWYPRRSREDSELDPDRTIREQFNLLQVVDNERYPAFFRLLGRRYRLRITGEPDG